MLSTALSYTHLIHRAREHELLYVLRKLLELKLWPGSLWAGISDDPSKYAIEQPSKLKRLFLYALYLTPISPSSVIDTSLSPQLLIADAVKRSSVAHLFHFYHVLCEIASIPRKTPSAWILATSSSHRTPNGINGKSDNIDADSQDIGVDDAEAVELDARTLARACLKEVGKEMGVSQ